MSRSDDDDPEYWHTPASPPALQSESPRPVRRSAGAEHPPGAKAVPPGSRQFAPGEYPSRATRSQRSPAPSPPDAHGCAWRTTAPRVRANAGSGAAPGDDAATPADSRACEWLHLFASERASGSRVNAVRREEVRRDEHRLGPQPRPAGRAPYQAGSAGAGSDSRGALPLATLRQ